MVWTRFSFVRIWSDVGVVWVSWYLWFHKNGKYLDQLDNYQRFRYYSVSVSQLLSAFCLHADSNLTDHYYFSCWSFCNLKVCFLFLHSTTLLKVFPLLIPGSSSVQFLFFPFHLCVSSVNSNRTIDHRPSPGLRTASSSLPLSHLVVLWVLLFFFHPLHVLTLHSFLFYEKKTTVK